MPVYVQEKHDGRSVGGTEQGQILERVFLVWQDYDPSVAGLTEPIKSTARAIQMTYAGAAINPTTSLPRVADATIDPLLLGPDGAIGGGDDFATGYGTIHPEDNRFKAIYPRVRRLANMVDGFEVTWTYKRYGSVGVVPGNEDPGEPGYVEVSLNYVSEFIDMWRHPDIRTGNGAITYPDLVNGAFGVVPIDGATNLPEQSDINGVPIDNGGLPTSWMNRKLEIEISRVEPRPTTVRASELGNAVGTRNNASFENFSAGVLLFTGADSTRIGDNRHRVVYRFVSDRLYHMRQQCHYDHKGEPILFNFGGLTLQAQSVFWVQPFPILTDFAHLTRTWWNP